MVQKKEEIAYRDLEKEDYPRLERIIGETWGFSRRCKDKRWPDFWKKPIGQVF